MHHYLVFLLTLFPSILLYLNLFMLLQMILLVHVLFIHPFIRMMLDRYLWVLCLRLLFLHAASEEEDCHIHHKDNAADIHLLISNCEGQVLWLSYHCNGHKRLYISTFTKKIRP